MPGCRGVPTKPTSRKRTSLLTWGLSWRRGPAPVQGARLPGSCWRRGRGPVTGDGLTGCKPSSSTWRSVGYARCGLNVWPGRPGRGEQCNCTLRRHCCNWLQQARALHQSEAFAGYRKRRVVVEHRLVQLGIRQARYFGRAKTQFQLYLAATVANLTLVAGKVGLTGDIGATAIGNRAACAGSGSAAANSDALRLVQIWTLALLTPAFLPEAILSTKAFHPHL